MTLSQLFKAKVKFKGIEPTALTTDFGCGFYEGRRLLCEGRKPIDLAIEQVIEAAELAMENDDAACAGPGTLSEALSNLRKVLED